MHANHLSNSSGFSTNLIASRTRRPGALLVYPWTGERHVSFVKEPSESRENGPWRNQITCAASVRRAQARYLPFVRLHHLPCATSMT